jgi:hypothetical protein
VGGYTTGKQTVKEGGGGRCRVRHTWGGGSLRRKQSEEEEAAGQGFGFVSPWLLLTLRTLKPLLHHITPIC